MLTVIALLVGLVVGGAATGIWLRSSSASAVRRSEEDRRRIVADAEREAETIRRRAERVLHTEARAALDERLLVL